MAAFTTFLKLYKPVANEDGWDDNFNSNLDIIDGFVRQYMNIANFQGAWQNSFAYSVGQVLLDVDLGTFFRCQVGHTSAATGTFSQDRAARPTFWATQTIAAQDSAAQAAASATAAANSAASALSTYNSFRTVYYGTATADPLTDPLGGARTVGDMYYNSTSLKLRVWQGTAWVDFPVPTVPEAPINALAYGRRNGQWVQVLPLQGPNSPTQFGANIEGSVAFQRLTCSIGIPANADAVGSMFANYGLFGTHSTNLYHNAAGWNVLNTNGGGMLISSISEVSTPGVNPRTQIDFYAARGSSPAGSNIAADLVAVMYGYDAGTTTGGHFTIRGQGFKPGGGVWADSSDARIKTVVGPYTAGLPEILEMAPKLFTYRGNDFMVAEDGSKGDPIHRDTTKQFIGVIAQDCQPYMPELVTTTTCYIDDTLHNDVLQVDATGLLYALVNAVITLEARVAALEAP